MQISSRFTIAVHILVALDYFGKEEKVTSSFLAGSVGVNPVIVRNVLGSLKAARLVHSSQGRSGIELARPLGNISFYDVYQAVDCVKDEGLFHFHENPNPACPVGRHIHQGLDARIQRVQQVMENEMRGIFLSDVVRDVQKETEGEAIGAGVKEDF